MTIRESPVVAVAAYDEPRTKASFFGLSFAGISTTCRSRNG